jgi:predicted GIY-YIG superfamily endonuclease
MAGRLAAAALSSNSSLKTVVVVQVSVLVTDKPASPFSSTPLRTAVVLCSSMNLSRRSLRPIQVRSAVCAVECENNHCYVFATQDISRDLMHHVQGSGAPFTVEHAPTGRVAVKMFEDDLEATACTMAAEYVDRGWLVVNEFDLSAEVLVQIYRMRLRPVLLKVQTYILETTPLQGCTYTGRYIGKTQNLSLRLPHHWNKTGANWTKVHPPLSIAAILLEGGSTAEEVVDHENKVTLKLMKEYIEEHGPDGWRSVRGGVWTELNMSKPHELTRGHD